MSLLAPRLWSLNTIFHQKEQVLLEEMIDSRSVAQNVPDEPGNFCHTTKKKKEATNNYKSHVQKNGDAKLLRFQSAQNGTTKHQRGQLPQ